MSTNTTSAARAALAGAELIPLAQACGHPLLRNSGRSGQRPHVGFLVRACSDGVRARNGQRIRLAGVRLGRKWMTSADAVARFISGLNDAGPAPLPEADAAHLAHVQAEAELDAAGIRR